MIDLTIRPLCKKTSEGVLYERDPKITAKLHELLPLSPEKLVERCEVQLHDLANYVPSECLVYFLRLNHAGDSWLYEQLYRLLAERILRRLPTRESLDRQTVSLTGSNIADEVFSQIIELLGKDRIEYVEGLDYFEVRFDSALKKRLYDAKKKVWRREKRNVPLEADPETGQLPYKFEAAIGIVDPIDITKLDDKDYRSRLGQAIDTLPPLQRQIIELISQGIPIYSDDPRVMTIAKTLEKSDKTIRNHRDQAYLALQTILKKGEKLS
jgi:hypothetical protein